MCNVCKVFGIRVFITQLSKFKRRRSQMFCQIATPTNFVKFSKDISLEEYVLLQAACLQIYLKRFHFDFFPRKYLRFCEFFPEIFRQLFFRAFKCCKIFNMCLIILWTLGVIVLIL